jgi:hypothetical protein
VIAIVSLGVLPVAAASGLVESGPFLYVVGDDQLAVTVLADRGARRVREVPLLEGALPSEHAARKRLKPDLEALAALPGDRLLALGSGSLDPRCRAAVLPLRSDEAMDPGPAQPQDLGPLYARLRRDLPELNVEGAAVSGDVLRLLQRGNGSAGVNALVDLDLAGVLAAIDAGRPWGAELLRSIRPVDLGGVPDLPAGARLGFTDASPLPGGWLVFTAAAEDTRDTYNDGACLGSAVGLLDPDGAIVFIERLDTMSKVEGVHAVLAGEVIELLLVADADDPAIPSPLYAASIDAPDVLKSAAKHPKVARV